MNRRSRLGIGKKIVLLFFLAPLLSISVFGAVTLNGMQDLGQDILRDAASMGNDAVDNSTAALMELAQKKMMDDAASLAAQTEVLLKGAMAEAFNVRDAASDLMARNRTGDISRYLSERFADIPAYDVLDIGGTRTGMREPIYSYMFVAGGDGRMLSVVGGEPAGYQNLSISNEHYFVKAKEAFGAGRDSYIYDAFMQNDSSGDHYWEPAVTEGVKVEDMIVLPRSEQRPFFVAIPSNIQQLGNRTYEQQADLAVRVLPTDGNWNPRQLGIIVMAAAKTKGALTAVSGIVMSLASATQYIRGLGQQELAGGRSGYGYMFNMNGVLISHPQQYHVGSDSSWHWWILDMSRNDTGFISYSWRGIFKFISYHEVRLPGMDASSRWMAVATSPSSDFTGPATETERKIDQSHNETSASISDFIAGTQFTFLGLGGVILFIALAVGMVLAALIVSPVKHLTAVAARLGQGDRDVLAREVDKAKIKKDLASRGDEIGGLATALEQVIKTLHDDLETSRKQSAELVRAVREKPTQMNLEIKDSIIYRSDIGQHAGGSVPADQPAKGYAICPYCGRELRFPKMPSFCPFCREKLQ